MDAPIRNDSSPPRHLVAGFKGRRPRSLVEVVECARHFGEFDPFVREFCDEFYIEQNAETRAAMLADEPPLTGDEKRDGCEP
jgi:hypothetical protein